MVKKDNYLDVLVKMKNVLNGGVLLQDLDY